MDPFLFTLQWEDWGVFDLSTGLSTIAIRDQMVRAMMLADRLPDWSRGEHGDGFGQWPVLVLGAGACGMTAAVALARRGFRVLILDRQRVPFFVQNNCTSRWLDATQYDWPLDHWRRGQFHWLRAHRRPPFHWAADRANAIVQNQWIPQLAAHRHAAGQRLRYRGGLDADLTTIRRINRLHFIDARIVGRQQVQTLGPFGAIVVATGFGLERSTLPNSPQFVGYPFWMTDPFEQLHCGLATKAQQGTVLISGTGDGALQDFLRIVTRRRSVRSIFDDLGLGGQQFAVGEIHSAEQKAEKALNWCRTRRDAFAAEYLEEVHQTHVRVAHTLAGNAAVQAAIQIVAVNRPTETILVNTEDCFSCTYGLNRFLALLLLAGIHDNSVRLLSRHRVEQIQSHPAHQPPANPTAHNCLGHSWQVTLRDLNTNTLVPSVDASVIILRHGVDTLPIAAAAAQSLHDGPRPAPPTHLYSTRLGGRKP